MNQLHMASIIFTFCIFFMAVLSDKTDENNSKVPLTPKVYAKVLRMRRKDHTALVQRMIKEDYTKNYKMISIALDKIFQVIKQSNQTLAEQNYLPTDGFPTDQLAQEAVTLLIEDTCLAGDLILHFPEISYKVLKKVSNWKEKINWCLEFVNHFPHITDELIDELIELVRQEINEDLRSPDFVNPYYIKDDTTESSIKKKVKKEKKIKKGPRLSTRSEL